MVLDSDSTLDAAFFDGTFIDSFPICLRSRTRLLGCLWNGDWLGRLMWPFGYNKNHLSAKKAHAFPQNGSLTLTSSAKSSSLMR